MGSAQAPPALVRFGVFEADLRAGELRRNGVRVVFRRCLSSTTKVRTPCAVALASC
jgi:hypothetical protein